MSNSSRSQLPLLNAYHTAGAVLSSIHVTHPPSEAGIRRSAPLLKMRELAHNTTGKPTGKRKSEHSSVSGAYASNHTCAPSASSLLAFNMEETNTHWESAALNMPANLQNSAVPKGLEKFCFHSNPKERQCQRMFKLTHNCTHLTH